MGLKGLDWSTVSKPTSEDVAEVSAGWYRVIMRYVSPDDAGSGGTRVCMAISPAFRLTAPFTLLRFEE
jgi:hypothetical protein